MSETESTGATVQQAAPPGAEEMPFQAEVRELLGLVINSLYANKEVFLRELISNASDALDRARFLAITNPDLAARQAPDPKIRIRLDDEARTLTVEDDGIGMTREEIVKNLGTIARSGSLEFLKQQAEAAKAGQDGLRLIGQFGVGFYAAFMVASRVDVHSLSLHPGSEPVIWRSTGSGTFTVLPGDRTTPGTSVTLHLKDDAREFAKAWRAKEIIQKYSDFVAFPIEVDGEQVNRSKAIWALPKSQVTDEQHTQFFRHVTGHLSETPLARVHVSIDAPVQFHALLYVPEKAPFDLFHKERRGVRLYAKRVLIMEECDKLTPLWLRFVRGVVDSEDLSLNVSREMLQNDHVLEQIEQQIVKSVLRMLKEVRDTDIERYDKIWREFGRVLKEGITLDWRRKDEIAELCRFESMKTEAGKLISLSDYVKAMPEDQKEIWYLTGPSRAHVERSPQLEVFRKRGFDVLFLTDAIDEWMVKSLGEFDKRRLRSVVHGDLDLADASDAKADAAVAAIKKVLGDEVKDVRVSKRLTDSASCLVADEGDPGANLERIMKMVDRSAKESKRILEINPSHPVVKNLDALAEKQPDAPAVRTLAEMLLDQALLSEGVVRDPTALVKRLDDLLVEASARAMQQV